MKVGITYDLREDYLAEGYNEEKTAEFDRADTIEAIEGTLQDLGFHTDRIGNVSNLISRLVKGDRWDLVFNIAEGLRGFGREAQVPAILDAHAIPYTFSDALVLALTLHKAFTKHVLRSMGAPTPDFFVVEEVSDAGLVDLPFPLFAKPVAEGTGKGINAASRVATKGQLISVCRRLLETYDQPVLVETFLPGREFTVGIIGTGKAAKAVGVMEVMLKDNAEAGVYSYWNKEKSEDLVTYCLVRDAMAEKAREVALAAWTGLGCRDAGRVDLRADSNGTPNVMEINPLAGLHPEHSDLCILAHEAGMGYRTLIATIISSAMERCRSVGKGS
jgi:D-alanine-D-alanine ligase